MPRDIKFSIHEQTRKRFELPQAPRLPPNIYRSPNNGETEFPPRSLQFRSTAILPFCHFEHATYFGKVSAREDSLVLLVLSLGSGQAKGLVGHELITHGVDGGTDGNTGEAESFSGHEQSMGWGCSHYPRTTPIKQ